MKDTQTPNLNTKTKLDVCKIYFHQHPGKLEKASLLFQLGATSKFFFTQCIKLLFKVRKLD